MQVGGCGDPSRATGGVLPRILETPEAGDREQEPGMDDQLLLVGANPQPIAAKRPIAVGERYSEFVGAAKL